MKNYFIYVTILILNISTYSQLNQDNGSYQPTQDEKLFVGEDLTYVVKYAFFNLGEVRFKVLEKTKINNISVYKTIAYIDSYPDLPFVSLHQVYESYIDSSFFPLKFYAKNFSDDTVFVEYNFTDDSKVEMKKVNMESSKILA